MRLEALNKKNIDAARLVAKKVIDKLMLAGNESGTIPLCKNINSLNDAVDSKLERAFEKELEKSMKGGK